MKTIHLYIALLVWVLLPIVTLAEKNKLLETIKNESDVGVIYEYISGKHWTSENLTIMKALWEKDFKTYPDLPREKLNDDLVRLALANVLLQAGRQCHIKIDMDEVHDFVKSKTKSSDIGIKEKAIYLLGMAGYDEDIPLFSSIVKSEQLGFAEQAALALLFFNSSAALNALQDLSKQVKRPSLKKALQELVTTYQNGGLTTKKCAE